MAASLLVALALAALAAAAAAAAAAGGAAAAVTPATLVVGDAVAAVAAAAGGACEVAMAELPLGFVDVTRRETAAALASAGIAALRYVGAVNAPTETIDLDDLGGVGPDVPVPQQLDAEVLDIVDRGANAFCPLHTNTGAVLAAGAFYMRSDEEGALFVDFIGDGVMSAFFTLAMLGPPPGDTSPPAPVVVLVELASGGRVIASPRLLLDHQPDDGITNYDSALRFAVSAPAAFDTMRISVNTDIGACLVAAGASCQDVDAAAAAEASSDDRRRKREPLGGAAHHHHHHHDDDDDDDDDDDGSHKLPPPETIEVSLMKDVDLTQPMAGALGGAELCGVAMDAFDEGLVHEQWPPRLPSNGVSAIEYVGNVDATLDQLSSGLDEGATSLLGTLRALCPLATDTAAVLVSSNEFAYFRESSGRFVITFDQHVTAAIVVLVDSPSNQADLTSITVQVAHGEQMGGARVISAAELLNDDNTAAGNVVLSVVANERGVFDALAISFDGSTGVCLAGVAVRCDELDDDESDD